MVSFSLYFVFISVYRVPTTTTTTIILCKFFFVYVLQAITLILTDGSWWWDSVVHRLKASKCNHSDLSLCFSRWFLLSCFFLFLTIYNSYFFFLCNEIRTLQREPLTAVVLWRACVVRCFLRYFVAVCCSCAPWKSNFYVFYKSHKYLSFEQPPFL